MLFVSLQYTLISYVLEGKYLAKMKNTLHKTQNLSFRINVVNNIINLPVTMVLQKSHIN